MNCPTCTVELRMADRQGIEIDYCPKCRGIWLDRGELDKLIERAQPQTPLQMPAPGQGRRENYRQYDDDDRDDTRNGYRRNRGFLGNLFDFD